MFKVGHKDPTFVLGGGFYHGNNLISGYIYPGKY
jgi:hypothetical protein